MWNTINQCSRFYFMCLCVFWQPKKRSLEHASLAASFWIYQKHHSLLTLHRPFSGFETPLFLERSSWIMKKLYPCLKTSSVSYVSYTPSRVVCLCAFVLYANLCLTYLAHLCDLGAALMRLIYTPCAYFPRTWHTLSVSLKIFLEWVCSPAKSSCFPRTIKGTTKRAVLDQKAVVKLFKWINFLSIIKTSWQFDVFLFFFSSLQTGGNKCFSLK